MKWWKRLWKNSKGQSLVEFAVVLVVMVTILLGTIDMGFMFFHQYGLSSIAKDTARAVSVGKNEMQIKQILGTDARMIFTPRNVYPISGGYVIEGPSHYKINVTVSGGPRRKGETVEVDVTYNYYPISFFLTEPITLSAKGATLIEETQ
jgi:hypothetical protein